MVFVKLPLVIPEWGLLNPHQNWMVSTGSSLVPRQLDICYNQCVCIFTGNTQKSSVGQMNCILFQPCGFVLDDDGALSVRNLLMALSAQKHTTKIRSITKNKLTSLKLSLLFTSWNFCLWSEDFSWGSKDSRQSRYLVTASATTEQEHT